MKKLFSLLLVAVMLFGLVACGSSEPEAQTQTQGGDATQATEAGKAFSVGYGRVDITPTAPTGLSGYGNDADRLHTEVLDFIYLSCVAVSDAQDNTFLFFSADLCSINRSTIGSLADRANKATGVPISNMIFNYSHTHSAPSGEGLGTTLGNAVAKAGEQAMADRKPATMFAGTAETSGINFVRHYYMNDGSVVTDNHGSEKGKTFASHTTEADQELRILQFKREGGKDVIMASWQSHPHLTGGSSKTSLCADIIGAFRTNMENDLDCHFSYFQGGAGNINPSSRISGEGANPNKDWRLSGQMLASAAKLAITNATELQTGPITVIRDTFACDTNKADLDLAPAAAEVRAYYAAGHSAAETQSYAMTLGLQSWYHANAIFNRSDLGDTLEIELTAVSFGDFGAVFAPCEMFDTTAKFIRENSPFAFTFACGYVGGGNGYFPTAEAYDYGCYEADTAKVARGTAEKVADRFVEILNELHG